MKSILVISILLTSQLILLAQKPRARDLGVPFNGTPGKLNSITDVAGVEVGHSTIITGKGKGRTWRKWVGRYFGLPHDLVIKILKKI